MIIRNAARCPNCKVIVESKHRHDAVTCPCGSIFVDGGHDYIRRGTLDQTNIWEIEELSVIETGECLPK